MATRMSAQLRLENHVLREVLPDFVDAWRAVHPEDPGYTFDGETNPICVPDGKERMRYDRLMVSAARGSRLRASGAELLGTEEISACDWGLAWARVSRASSGETRSRVDQGRRAEHKWGDGMRPRGFVNLGRGVVCMRCAVCARRLHPAATCLRVVACLGRARKRRPSTGPRPRPSPPGRRCPMLRSIFACRHPVVTPERRRRRPP